MAIIEGILNNMRMSDVGQNNAIQYYARTREILASALTQSNRSAMITAKHHQLQDLLRISEQIGQQRARNAEFTSFAPGFTNNLLLTPNASHRFTGILQQPMQRHYPGGGILPTSLGLTNCSMLEETLTMPRSESEILASILSLTEQQSARARDTLASVLALSPSVSLVGPIRLCHLSDVLQGMLAQIEQQRTKFGEMLVATLTSTYNTPTRPRRLSRLLADLLIKIEQQSSRTGDLLEVALDQTHSISPPSQIRSNQAFDTFEAALKQAGQQVSASGTLLTTAIGLIDMLTESTLHPVTSLTSTQTVPYLARNTHTLDSADGIEHAVGPFLTPSLAIQHPAHGRAFRSAFETPNACLTELIAQNEREIKRQCHRFLSSRAQSTMIRKKTGRRKRVRDDELNRKPSKRQKCPTAEQTGDDCRSCDNIVSTGSKPATDETGQLSSSATSNSPLREGV